MQTIWPTAKPETVLPESFQEVYLQKRPDGLPTSDTFAQRTVPLPLYTNASIPSDKCVVRVLYVSVDPAMRGWLSTRKSYIAPVRLGARMRALGLGVIERSATASHIGRLAIGPFGWSQFSIVNPSDLTFVNLPRGVPSTVMLGVLGTTGLTAYFGLLHIGKPRRGDVVVVSAAAGATGSVAVQMAKVLECSVVGIAGGKKKCAYLEDVLGVPAVDYKSEEGVDVGLKRVLKGRTIDVYFDNVGGAILEAALRKLSRGARVVLCGGISSYNETEVPPGPRNYLALISARASMTGFLVYDFEKEFPKAYAQLTRWLLDGRIQYLEDEVIGLENAPRALQRLFDGANLGKVIVRVADDARSLVNAVDPVKSKL